MKLIFSKFTDDVARYSLIDLNSEIVIMKLTVRHQAYLGFSAQ